MQTLVTGATGFLGTALCAKLEELGHEVTRLNSRNADLTQSDALEPLSDTHFDAVFHLAAWTQAGDFCLHHPGEQWIINQQINTTVLSWWAQRQPEAKLVCMGTSCAYAPDSGLTEEEYLLGEPIEGLYTYAMTKRMLYVGLKALTQQYGLRYLCLVPSTLYGPGYHRDGRQMHFIFDLVRKILLGKKRGDKVVLWGDGHQRRELVFISDFVDIMLDLAETQENTIVNVGAGEEYSIRHFAQLICDVVGYNFSDIRFDTERYVGARSKCLDVSRLHALLPDIELTPLADGIRATTQWMEQESGLLAL